jgi:hypothetical protein
MVAQGMSMCHNTSECLWPAKSPALPRCDANTQGSGIPATQVAVLPISVELMHWGGCADLLPSFSRRPKPENG